MSSFTIQPALRSTSVRLIAPVGGVIIPAGAKTATVSLLMPVDSERANSSQHLDFGVDLLIAPSTNWKLAFVSAGWNGGGGLTGKNSTVVNPPGSVTLGGDFLAAWAGNSARLFATLKEPMTVGAKVVVT